jgi:histidine triad (HIT) family protein
MAFTAEIAEEIKRQLIIEIEKLPNDNKEEIKKYIETLDDEGLEEFLKKNKIKYTETGISQELAEGEEGKIEKCIFCQITKNEIPSYKIAENKKAIAVLEINPFSKGHVIIIPTEHATIEKMPKATLSLAQKIAKKLKKKLKPEDIKIETSSFQGHPMVNVIPLYKDIPLKKSKATEEDLKKLQSKLETKTRAKRKKQSEEKDSKTKKPEDISKFPEISFRIP